GRPSAHRTGRQGRSRSRRRGAGLAAVRGAGAGRPARTAGLTAVARHRVGPRGGTEGGVRLAPAARKSLPSDVFFHNMEKWRIATKRIHGTSFPFFSFFLS